jgi:hypothetical protein
MVAKAHPGGVRILQKFHTKDATKAFNNAGHSKAAYEMLKDFEISLGDDHDTDFNSSAPRISSPVNQRAATATTTTTTTTTTSKGVSAHILNHKEQSPLTVPRWRRKLFTKEDPIGIHKYLGLFVLLNFLFRFGQMYFGDPAAGLGTRLGKGPSWIPFLCLVPHGLLSLSSLIFHTVPKERVVSMPMIWKEYRIHNILFGMRSILTAMICSLSIRYSHKSPIIRPIAILTSCLICLTAMIGADFATFKLRVNDRESTTATMPYWNGCSVDRQKYFKTFYAYSQFMATFACFLVTNPAFSLAVLLAIQLASLLMTLVRKGLLSTRGYHMIYTATLVAPYFVALRSMLLTRTLELPIAFATASILFCIRRRGVSKYMIWIPMMVARIAFGDKLMPCTKVW